MGLLDPIQCLGNPWEQAWLEEHDHDYDSYPTSESERLAIFEDYYGQKGVEIYDIRHKWVYETVCGACSCPNGDRILCEIDKQDLDEMLEWGFVEE